MKINVKNYPIVTEQFEKGLDYISQKIVGTSSEADLADVIFEYIKNLYYPTISMPIEVRLKSEIYSILNVCKTVNIINKLNDCYDSDLMPELLNILPGLTSIDDISHRLDAIENDIIISSDISNEERKSLILSCELGIKSYEYFYKLQAEPKEWGNFIKNSSSFAIYSNIPYWVRASIKGSLIGAMLVDNADSNNSDDECKEFIVNSLVGSLICTVGKIIFGWDSNAAFIVNGFSEVYGANEYLIKENSNSYCSNSKKCLNTGTNTCSNTGSFCTNTCTNNCIVKK
jgi:hypothetical protein